MDQQMNNTLLFVELRDRQQRLERLKTNYEAKEAQLKKKKQNYLAIQWMVLFPAILLFATLIYIASSALVSISNQVQHLPIIALFWILFVVLFVLLFHIYIVMMTFTLYKWGGLLPLLLPLSDVIFLFVFLFTQHKRKRDVKECTQEIEQIKDNIKRCEIEIDNIKLYLGGMTNNFI